MDPQERFAALVEELAAEPGVTPPDAAGGRRFGSAALKVDGAIFAMLYDQWLVVKLPRPRVEALLADGTGGPFGAGKGRPMREWVTVLSADEGTWSALAREALAFVSGPAR